MVLMERAHTGLSVELDWMFGADELALYVHVGSTSEAISVPTGRAMDAFNHPMVYLSDAQVASLFPRRAEEEACS